MHPLHAVNASLCTKTARTSRAPMSLYQWLPHNLNFCSAWNITARSHFPALLPEVCHARLLPHRLARKRKVRNVYDSPVLRSCDSGKRLLSSNFLLLSAAGAMGPHLPCISEDALEEAALQINRIMDCFLPALCWRLRLCILLSIVSGDPCITLEDPAVRTSHGVIPVPANVLICAH